MIGVIQDMLQEFDDLNWGGFIDSAVLLFAVLPPEFICAVVLLSGRWGQGL